MTQTDIMLCGKQVKVAYNFATEITFHDLTNGVDIANFDATNPKQVVLLILAAMQSYYTFEDMEMPIKDSDLMRDAKPVELIKAISAIVELRKEWYAMPDDEADKDEGEKPKNA